MRRRRRSFKNRDKRLDTILVVVIVVVEGIVRREMSRDRDAVASLVRDQAFILDMWIAHESRQDRQPSRAGNAAGVLPSGGIAFGGNPFGPGNGGPEHVAFIGRPGQPGAGHQAEAGVVVVVDLGAYGEVQSVGEQGELILREPAEGLHDEIGRTE